MSPIYLDLQTCHGRRFCSIVVTKVTLRRRSASLISKKMPVWGKFQRGSSRLVKVAMFVPCEVEAQKTTGCPELIVEPPVRAVCSALLPNVPLITWTENNHHFAVSIVQTVVEELGGSWKHQKQTVVLGSFNKHNFTQTRRNFAQTSAHWSNDHEMIYNERTMKKLLVSGAPPFIFQDSKIEGTPRIVGELAFYLKWTLLNSRVRFK